MALERDGALTAQSVTLGYGSRVVTSDLSLEIPTGGFTVIIGPNACGKSTLLRALGRMLQPSSGQVLLDGKNINSLPTKAVARQVGLLPQAPITPEGITVADLVARGRYPHQAMLRQWSRADEDAVIEALTEVGMLDQADRYVDELSGGQRQRAWIALTLAQQTPVVLLDEPTTFLDIAHQLEILNLCAQLHESGRTLVAVLHDLNLAARYATNLVAMRDGRIVRQGAPETVVTPELLASVFDLDALMIADPETGRPLVVPRDSRGQRGADRSSINTEGKRP